MKAIIIKDDRDIKFIDIRCKMPQLHFAKMKPLQIYDANLENISEIIIYKEIYELIHIRKNGDLIYRLQR